MYTCKKYKSFYFLLAFNTKYCIFTYMHRNHEVQLRAWKGDPNRKPLVVRGARQVGKTWSLKKFGRENFAACHYLNFEEDERLAALFEPDLKPDRILNDLRFRLNTNIQPSTDLLIFDEVQRCGRALTSLKYFAEEMPGIAICAAGSLLGVTLSDVSFPVGKVRFLDLYPMTFAEFTKALHEDMLLELMQNHTPCEPYPQQAHERLWELWKRYLVVGGLPAAVSAFVSEHENLFEAVRNVRAIQLDLIDSYLADVAKHSGKTNALHIERVWSSIPGQLARQQEGGAPRFIFKGVVPGVRGYERLAGPIDWLDAAGLILRTSIVEKPWIPLSGYAAENKFKLYLFDTGLLGALAGIDPSVFLRYGFGSYQGYIAENFVAQELIAAGIQKLYCWQGRTSEIEFLIPSGASVIPIEVKSGNVVHSKSMGVFEQRFSPEFAILLSAHNSRKSKKRLYAPLYAAAKIKEIRDPLLDFRGLR